MKKIINNSPVIDLHLPSGVKWHMLPSSVEGLQSESIAGYIGPYPEEDSCLPTYEQAAELIEQCNFSYGGCNGEEAYLLQPPTVATPIVAPILAYCEVICEKGAAFWVKGQSQIEGYAYVMIFSPRAITIGVTLKSNACMILPVWNEFIVRLEEEAAENK